MAHRSLHLLAILLIGLIGLLPSGAMARPRASLPAEEDVQLFLESQPGALKTYREGEQSAAQLIQGAAGYYSLSPRIVLALLETRAELLSDPNPGEAVLRRPFGPFGPDGFGAQIDWAMRELRAGLGPYDRAPMLRFTDGTTTTLTLAQAPEGVAVQRFLARERTQPAWRADVERFGQIFQHYFHNELPEAPIPRTVTPSGFLQRPWPASTRVVHLSYFDHMFPTVDSGQPDNGYVVNYLGRGNVQYDGHDGHDFYFPDQPIGTLMLAAADGIAYARTHRGNGVVIIHPDGYETIYWHLDRFAAIFKDTVDTNQGVRVRAGDVIGSSGKTGFTSGTPHLHFEVRRYGRQVDPYGWYGPGSDPCAAYAACEASVWLWHASLAGEGDFTPPGAAVPDTTPPTATLAVNPTPDLLFLARFDGHALQQVGAGAPVLAGAPRYEAARFGQGIRLAGSDRLAYPIAGNLRLDAGTIAFWARLPETYPSNGTGRNYLLTASAHPDEGPVYTGTLSLRRDLLGPGGAPRWDFWTTPESGLAGRHDLAVPDTLAPGLHHFAISWDRAAGAKALYLDGELAAEAEDVELPTDVGALLELSRFSPGFGLGGATLDEVAIFGRALLPSEVAALAEATHELRAGAARVGNPALQLDTNAFDDAGGIMSVRLGIDGVFDDPQPYADNYTMTLPLATGAYTVAAQFFDRAGNSATISASVTLTDPPQPIVTLEDVDELGATLVFSATGEPEPIEVQASATPDFASALWRPLPLRMDWMWTRGAPRVVWLRFRAGDVLSSPQVYGPDAGRQFLPIAAQHPMIVSSIPR